MISRISPDPQKAKSLLAMAEITLQRLRETDTTKYSSNALTDYYDIIHKIMESIASIEGIKIKGEGAHQELINYICKEHIIAEVDRIFLQEMREYRNRISYEGFNINKEYIEANHARIEAIIAKLKLLCSAGYKKR